jgi:type IV fimbrial biogenesis protein FimT
VAWPMRKSRGLTLLELMAVIALVAILMTLAAPSFQGFTANQQVRSASGAITGALNYARSQAVTRNTDVVIERDANDWANGWSISVNGEVLAVQNELPGVNIVAPGATLTYNREGRVTTNNFRFDIAAAPNGSGATQHCVTVSLSGMPSTRQGAC